MLDKALIAVLVACTFAGGLLVGRATHNERHTLPEVAWDFCSRQHFARSATVSDSVRAVDVCVLNELEPPAAR